MSKLRLDVMIRDGGKTRFGHVTKVGAATSPVPTDRPCGRCATVVPAAHAFCAACGFETRQTHATDARNTDGNPDVADIAVLQRFMPEHNGDENAMAKHPVEHRLSHSVCGAARATSDAEKLIEGRWWPRSNLDREEV